MGDLNKIRHCYIIHISKQVSIDYANECAQSCKQHFMPYTLWQGCEGLGRDALEKETGVEWVTGNPVSPESNCTGSHIKLWREIANQPHACAVFEHDAIVKKCFYDVEIPDLKLVMLGFRVLHKDHYTPPHMPYSFIDINIFEGTHAYAITPMMAQHLLNRIETHYTDNYGGVDTTVDGLLSIQDKLGIERVVIEPPPVVAQVGNRESTCQSRPATYNKSETPGFLAGHKPTA